MSARWMIGLTLALSACAGGDQDARPEGATPESAVLDQFVGTWVQNVPSTDLMPYRLTCRIGTEGQFRLILQHGHMRPFADYRGKWTLREDGQLGVRFHTEGAEPDTITVRADQGRVIVPFPLNELEELVFGVRLGAPPST